MGSGLDACSQTPLSAAAHETEASVRRGDRSMLSATLAVLLSRAQPAQHDAQLFDALWASSDAFEGRSLAPTWGRTPGIRTFEKMSCKSRERQTGGEAEAPAGLSCTPVWTAFPWDALLLVKRCPSWNPCHGSSSVVTVQVCLLSR